MSQAGLPEYLARADDWPGWFHRTDRELFQLVAAVQAEQGLSGDLLEIGVFLGKSAALLGHLRQPGERLVVCDVFEAVPYPEAETQREAAQHFQGLSRTEFERHYLSGHDELPDIVEDLSTSLRGRGLGRRFRFAHVDGDHAYDTVREDARTARDLLVAGGIVVFDDWRTGHLPGVHAAVWGAVHEDGLVPLVLSDAKFYGTYAPLNPAAVAFRDAVSESPDYLTELHSIAGHLVVLLTPALVA